MKNNLLKALLALAFIVSAFISNAQTLERFDIRFPNGEKKLIGFTKEKTWVRYKTDSGIAEIKMKLGFILRDSLFDYRPDYPVIALKDIVAIKKAGMVGRTIKNIAATILYTLGGPALAIGLIVNSSNTFFDKKGYILAGAFAIAAASQIENYQIRKWQNVSSYNSITSSPTRYKTSNWEAVFVLPLIFAL